MNYCTKGGSIMAQSDRFITIIFWSIWGIFLCSSLLATEIIPLSFDNLVAHSQLISYVRCRNVTVEEHEGERIYTRVELDILERLKGAGEGHSHTLKLLGGKGQKRATIVPGMPQFRPGEEMILFMERLPQWDYPIPTGLAQGKLPVVTSPSSTAKCVQIPTEQIRAANGSLVPRFPYPDSCVPLERFLQDIRAKVR
jgi:hypothetical protein